MPSYTDSKALAAKPHPDNPIDMAKRKGPRIPPYWRKRLLTALEESPHLNDACKFAGVSNWFVRAEVRRSSKFGKEVDDAIARGWQKAEKAVYEVAFRGERNPIWMKDAAGRPVKVDETRKLNAPLAMFLLKAHNPAKYRETVALTGADGGPVQHEFTVNLTAAELGVFAPKKLAEGAVDVEAKVTTTNGHAGGHNGKDGQ